MSVIVKGMKMPKSCRNCLFRQLNVGAIAQDECFIKKRMNDQYTYFTSKRPEWCPLVEIPEKHGRLIDGDMLKAEIEEMAGYNEAERFNDYYLCEQPVILEAEE